MLETWHWIVIAIFIVTSLIETYVLYRWVSSPTFQLRREQTKLFQELCSVHKLSPNLKSTLQMMIYEYKVDPPCNIFIQPELFETSQIPASLQPRAEAIGQLRTQLFEHAESFSATSA
jgi:hypothetical protein